MFAFKLKTKAWAEIDCLSMILTELFVNFVEKFLTFENYFRS